MKNKYKLLILSGLLSFLIISLTSQTTQDPKAKTVLDATSTKFSSFKTLKIAFKQTLKATNTKNNATTTGNAQIKGSKYKITLGDGQVIINNGVNIWHYIKSDCEVSVYAASEAEDMFDIKKMVNKYKTGYKYWMVNENEKVGTHTCYHIEMNPLKPGKGEDAQITKIKISIDKTTKQVVQWVISERNGNKYTFDITTFESNKTIDDNVFVFKKTDYKTACPTIETIQVD